MQKVEARITAIQMDLLGRMTAWITCPESAVPGPGQFCQAQIPGDDEDVLPVTFMAGEVAKDGYLAVPALARLPSSWVPGVTLSIRGPQGRGFSLPENTGRLALAACEETIARLYPLAAQAAERGADISWFTDAPVPSLPTAYELNPLRLLPDALTWADFMVLEVSMARLAGLRRLVGLQGGMIFPCPAQVLVLTSMPCSGQAECGACAVPARRGWKLACVDGPVFDLKELDW